MTTSVFELLRVPSDRHSFSSALVLSISVALVAAVAAGAYFTDYEIRFSVLYLAPIALATWFAGPRAGTFITVISSVSWMIAFWSSRPQSPPFYFFWEGSMTIAMFLVFVALIARLHQALANSDSRLLTVLEGLNAAVHVEDARTGASLYHNRRFVELFGGPRGFSRDNGEVYDERSGAWYLVQSRVFLWTDGREAVLRMLSDVTEERMARQFAAGQREAAHKTSRMVALGGLASGIAHELNQPLTAISTYNNACLRLLETGSSGSDELREAMQKCREQARRAGDIIQRLREILHHPVRPAARLDLCEVASAVRRLAEHEAAEAGVAVELAIGGRLPAVRGDQLLVEQVALNLVRNAIEAVRELPRERRRVMISTGMETGGHAFLAVSDLGEGVSSEVSGRLFEAFVTTKPGGLGLGLSICRSVIESLGGAIRHDHDAGCGARFSFRLPAADR